MKRIYSVVLLAEGEDGKTIEFEEETEYWKDCHQPPGRETEDLAILQAKEKYPLLKRIRAKFPHGLSKSGRRWW